MKSIRLLQWTCGVLLLATTLVPAVRADTVAPGGEPVTLFEPFVPKSSAAIRSFTGALAAHPVHIRVDRIPALTTGQRLRLALSATEAWDATVRQVEHRDTGSSVFGSIEGSPGAWFVLTLESGGLMGSFGIPQEKLVADLRHLEGDDFAVVALDAGLAGRFDCGVGRTPATSPPVHEGGAVTATAPAVSTITPPPPQHDVCVVYTQGLVNDFPNHFPNTPLDTGVQHLVDFTNMCYANSGVALHMRLAYRGLVDPTFSEMGHTREWLLDALTSTTDGILDNVHTLRANYHADIVCLLYSYDTQATGTGGGKAQLLDAATFGTGDPSNWYSNGFCVVEALWQPSSYDPPLGGMALTEFAHEMGHVQGMGHDCEDDPGTPATNYAFGWRFIGSSGTHYADVMSYLTGSYATATQIPYFGNPAINYDGQPTGTNAPQCGYTAGARTAVALGVTADFISRLYLKPLDPWVDFAYGGATSGRFEAPWTSFGQAIVNLPDTDPQHTPTPPTVTFKGPAATGYQAVTASRRMVLDASGGAVRIGAP